MALQIMNELGNFFLGAVDDIWYYGISSDSLNPLSRHGSHLQSSSATSSSPSASSASAPDSHPSAPSLWNDGGSGRLHFDSLIRDVFEFLDVDKNGRVGIHEIHSLFQKLDHCTISDPYCLLSLIQSVNHSPYAVDLDFTQFQALYGLLFPEEKIEAETPPERTKERSMPLNPTTFAAVNNAVDDSVATAHARVEDSSCDSSADKKCTETFESVGGAAVLMGASNSGIKKEEEHAGPQESSNSETEEEEEKREEGEDVDEAEEDDIVRAFKVYDANGDGFISASELAIVLQKLDLLPASEECSTHDVEVCQAFINRVDADGDGLVSLEEFKAMFYGEADKAQSTGNDKEAAASTIADGTNVNSSTNYTTTRRKAAGDDEVRVSVLDAVAYCSKLLVAAFPALLSILSLSERVPVMRFVTV